VRIPQFPVIVRWFTLVAVFVIGAEATARIEDRLRSHVPFLSSPDRDADLVLHDGRAIRGRPHGEFKRWHLNQFGFRGPDMPEMPQPNCIRVMTLGASETFGLYESEKHEYPAQLADVLRDRGCFEVVNASLYGLTLPAIHQNWNGWSSRFQPRVVTIYPTPAFYLGERAPGRPSASAAPASRPPWWRLRLRERATDVIEFPGFIQRWRVARALNAIESQHPDEWFFQSVPIERLTQFERDLDALVQDIKLTRASVVLMTHATRFRLPITDDQQTGLAAWRQIVPRPTPEVLLQFEAAAADATRRIATRHSVPVADLARHFEGRSQWFAGDGIHFNDEGAAVVADLVARAVLESLAQGKSQSALK
jgi:lysophospholipase L1-like esterase